MPKRKVDSDEEASFEDDYEEKEQPKSKKAQSKGKAKPSKRRQIEEEEEEDEDEAVSSEEEPVAPKKKTTKKPTIASSDSPTSSKVKKSAEGDSYIDLGKKKRATVREFKGSTLIDIREFYGAEGEEKPGKKGISLSSEQWQVLRDNADTIDQLCRALKK